MLETNSSPSCNGDGCHSKLCGGKPSPEVVVTVANPPQSTKECCKVVWQQTEPHGMIYLALVVRVNLWLVVGGGGGGGGGEDGEHFFKK